MPDGDGDGDGSGSCSSSGNLELRRRQKQAEEATFLLLLAVVVVGRWSLQLWLNIECLRVCCGVVLDLLHALAFAKFSLIAVSLVLLY